MGKMIAVEYEEEARFIPQRVFFRIASIAAMFYTSKEMDGPPNGRFWNHSRRPRACLETEYTCGEDKTLVVPEGSIPLATPVSLPDREF